MCIESRFCAGLANPAINDDWPETWEQTLGIQDESEIRCPNCDEFAAQLVCPSFSAEILTLRHKHHYE